MTWRVLLVCSFVCSACAKTDRSSGVAGSSAAGDARASRSGASVGVDRDHINGDPVTGDLGEFQCPLDADRSCADGCFAVNAVEIDREAACERRLLVVDCTTQAILPDQQACRVHLGTGQIYGLPQLTLDKPGFLGWRECTDDERSELEAAASSRCS